MSLKNSRKPDHVSFCYFLNRSTELSNLAYFEQYSYFSIRVPNVFTHFPFVFTRVPFVFTRVHSFSFVFHSCSLVFIRVPFVFHSCSFVFHSCSFLFQSCSLVFSRVPLVFIRIHSCSLVFTRVHSCSDVCGVLDMIFPDTHQQAAQQNRSEERKRGGEIDLLGSLSHEH